MESYYQSVMGLQRDIGQIDMDSIAIQVHLSLFVKCC